MRVKSLMSEKCVKQYCQENKVGEGSGSELSEDTWTPGISRHQSTEEEKIAALIDFRVIHRRIALRVW